MEKTEYAYERHAKPKRNELPASCTYISDAALSSYAHGILPSIMKIFIVLSLDFKVSLNKVLICKC